MNRSIIFLLLSFYSLYSLAQSTASENVSIIEVNAKKLDTLKKIWVYLPKSYESSDKKFPVIYMHDAQNLFDNETSFVGEWNVDETLDRIKNPEAIVIGIEHGGRKRIEELTPFPHEKYGGGKADDYLDFLLNDLKPKIDSTFRTLPDYSNTGIFGSSLGGLLSFYAAIKCPDTFGMIGVFSPSFWFNSKIYDMAEHTSLNPNTKFYFLVGTEESEEMVPDLNEMIVILQENGLSTENFQVKYVEGGEHNEALWRENFLETFTWLLKM